MIASDLAAAERAARTYGHVLARYLRRFSPYDVERLTKIFLDAFLETMHRSGQLTIGQILTIAAIPMDLAMKLQKTPKIAKLQSTR